jgi:hypothetical protein
MLCGSTHRAQSTTFEAYREEHHAVGEN